MPNRARAAGRAVWGVFTKVTACAWYSSTLVSVAPVASWPPMTNTLDDTTLRIAAAPWFRRRVNSGSANGVQVPGPTGSALKRWTGVGLAIDGPPSGAGVAETTRG